MFREREIHDESIVGVTIAGFIYIREPSMLTVHYWFPLGARAALGPFLSNIVFCPGISPVSHLQHYIKCQLAWFFCPRDGNLLKHRELLICTEE